MAKRCRSIVSVIVTGAVALAVMLATSATVFAESRKPRATVYTSMYYFSDSMEYWDQKCGFIEDARQACGSIDVKDVHTYCYEDNFVPMLYAMQEGEQFANIQDAIVIVEMRKSMSTQIIDYSSYLFTDLLDDIFGTLKGNDCKIMFISGTDEDRIRFCKNYNGRCFLQYVDFHVNTDVLYRLYFDLMYYMKDECGMQYVTILLDEPFSDGDFIDKWIISGIRCKLYEELKNNAEALASFDSEGSFWQYYGIRIFRHPKYSGEPLFGRLQDISQQIYYYSADDDGSTLLNGCSGVGHVYPFGSTGLAEESDLSVWANMIEKTAEHYGAYPCAYLFETIDRAISGLEIGNILSTGQKYVDFDDVWLNTMLYDFAVDNYAKYDNYNGEAAVSQCLYIEGIGNGKKHGPCSSESEGEGNSRRVNQTQEEYTINYGSWEEMKAVISDEQQA